MYLGVAQRARLKQARLVVKRWHARCTAKTRRRVTLQAQQVDVAQFQHVRIWSAVRQMARLASFHLHRGMLVHKRPLLVRVAFKTNRILRRGSSHLFGLYRSVYVVAVAALD